MPVWERPKVAPSFSLVPDAEDEPESPPREPAPRLKSVKPRPPAKTPPVTIAPPAEITPVESAPPTPAVSRPQPPEKHPLPIRSPLAANAPHLRVPHETIDRLRKLKPGPRVVCEEIFRAAAGWHSDVCVISITKLAQHCRIEEKVVRKYVAQLQSEGFVERLDDVLGGRDVGARGARFRILLPRMPGPTPGTNAGGANPPPNKEKPLKKDSKSAVCDLCKNMNGMVYGDPDNPSLGVKRCDHR